MPRLAVLHREAADIYVCVHHSHVIIWSEKKEGTAAMKTWWELKACEEPDEDDGLLTGSAALPDNESAFMLSSAADV